MSPKWKVGRLASADSPTRGTRGTPKVTSSPALLLKEKGAMAGLIHLLKFLIDTHSYNLRHERTKNFHEFFLRIHYLMNILIGHWRLIETRANQFDSRFLKKLVYVSRKNRLLGFCSYIVLSAPCEAEFIDSARSHSNIYIAFSLTIT